MTDSESQKDHFLDKTKDGEEGSSSKYEDKLSSLIEEKLRDASNPFSVDRCISRIPDVLRKHNEKAFVPILVSIGPFHHGIKNLKAMQEFKLYYLRRVLNQKPPRDTTNLEDLVEAIRTKVEDFLKCYAEKFEMSSDEFVEMMVIDGCFIIEFCRRIASDDDQVSADDNEYDLFSKSWMRLAVMNDLVLLENQIPWGVLESLFVTRKLEKPDLPELILKTFSEYTDGLSPKPSDERLKNRHLLDFIRNSLLGSSVESESNLVSEVPSLIPSVTELRLAGVKFKCRNGGDKMLKITFTDGVMKLPRILAFKENGESLFGNLIAYEQCHPSIGDQITSYVMVLENLIKSSKDAEVLVEKGILQKIWSKKELAGFFSRVYSHPRLYKFSYLELQAQMDAYFASAWHKWKMTLRRDYLKNPWSRSS